MTVDLTRLAALDDAATKPPWHGVPHTWPERAVPIFGPGRDVAVTMSNAGLDQRIADAALIAEVRNALPALIVELRMLRARSAPARMTNENDFMFYTHETLDLHRGLTITGCVYCNGDM